MSILILARLLAAHLTGDFFLQTDRICKGKFSTGTERLAFLAIHCGINAAMAYLFAALWTCWQIPVVVFVTHYAIDFVKSSIKSKSIWVFLLDQLAHVAVIVALWVWLTGAEPCLSCEWLSDYRIWVVALCYMLALKPTSILLGMFIARWTPPTNARNSLPNAGAWIGYLERVLIVTFMLVGCLEGIGFLLAAKSIFRFGDLTKGREVKITEYVMIGTLSSFTVAILLGAIALKALN